MLSPSASRAFFILSFFILPLSLSATDYYMGSAASAQSGVALADIGALNSVDLNPGDRVFFQGGESFSGTIHLGPEDTGSPASPIVISSFGTNRATIAGGMGAAIKIDNSSGFAISRLNLVGAGAATSKGNGIDAGVYLPGSTKLAYLRFSDMTISGFENGVVIWAWYSTATRAWPGFTDVKLQNLQVFSNRSEGIKTWGTWYADGNGQNFSHSDISISHCAVWDNRGDPTANYHTGSGIIMSGVDRGLVEYCVAHDNGGYGPASGGGPFGIWAWEARGVTLQYNLVYNQKTSSMNDGGAYDLDGGSSNCVVQYNYSYNNDGPTIGIIQFQDASPLVNNVVRFNISENDSRKTTQGLVYVGEFSEPYGIKGAEIYGNTFFVSTNARGNNPPILFLENHDDIADVHFRNNLFVSTHSGSLFKGVTNNPAKYLFQGNNYWGGTFDLAAFRASGQEKLNGVSIGSRLDPQLNDSGKGGIITDPTQLPAITAYLLSATSPLRQQGLDLTRTFGIEPGPHDFYGLPLSTDTLDIGASSNSGETPPPPPPPAGNPDPTTFLDDDFSGSGSLSGRTPDTANIAGGKWTILTGSASVADGVVSTNNTLRAVIDSGAADCRIETSIVYGVTDTGIILRSSDSSNYLRIALTNSTLRLLKTQAGSTTSLASKNMTFAPDRTYVLRADLNGTAITIFVDGNEVLSAITSFNQTGKRHGLLTSNSGTRKWHRFTVSSSLSAPVPVEDVEEAPVVEPVEAPSTTTSVVDDHFNGSGSLAGRTPDTSDFAGNKWVIFTGSGGTGDGLLSTSNTLRAAVDAGIADGVVEVPIVFGAIDTGVILRCKDSSNYLRITLSKSTLLFQKTEAGATKTLGSTSIPLVLGRTYVVRAELSGATVSISIDGMTVATHTTTFNQTATRHGVLSSNSGVRKWERFTVSPL